MTSSPVDLLVPRRLDKWLRDSTRLTVKEVREAIREGRVRIRSPSGEVPCVDMETMIFGDDFVLLDDAIARPLRQHQTALFNKPVSVTATLRDPRGKRDLSQWLAQMPEGCMPVGRLDRETTGALLFTTDGDLANALLQPDHHTTKVYHLWLSGRLDLTDPRIAAFETGIQTSIGLLKAHRARVGCQRDDATELIVSLTEGKNRQLRRMCYAGGLRLLQLHRASVGPISLTDLESGQWRLLSDVERADLWAATGGRARVRQRKVAALRRQAVSARTDQKPLQRLEKWLDALSQESC